MWLKAKVTYDVGSRTGQTAQATTVRPVLSQAALSNAGFAHHNELGYLYEARHATAIRHLYAQGFTTGSDTSGYLLTAVRLSLFADGLTETGTWAVHADDAGKPAAEPLSAARPILNADIPIGLIFRFQEFTHPDGVRVEPDTKYWIVISQTTPGDDGEIGIAAWGEWTGALEEGLATPPVDPGSGDGWSVDFRALTYYWDDPDNPDDDDGPYDEEGNPIHRELLPWQTFARGLEVEGRFVLRMALRVAPEVTVQFTQDSYTVAEGGTQSVTVTLSADPERSLVIPIKTAGEGGATAADYSAPTSVTFNAGETSKSFTFAAPQDTLDDDDESVKLGFGTMPDAWVSAGTTDETTVSITDDDDPFVTVEFGASAYTVEESDDTTTPGVTENEVEVTVTLSADPERSVDIPITKVNQGTASDADYSGVPSSVVFASGETEKSITFTAVDDALNDDGERVQLGFGSLPDRVSAGAPAETTVNITDDDVPAITVSFEYAAYTVAEGGTVEVTVTLDQDLERTVTIPITTVNQGTASDDDYSGVPESVTFQSGETEKTITFMAVDDTEDEDGESVRLAFGALPGAVLPGSHTEATMHITDDVPAVTVSFFFDRYDVYEGETWPIGVGLSADPGREVIIPITATGLGGASPADYSGVPQTVTFSRQEECFDSGGEIIEDGICYETGKSFTITAARDDDDGGEAVLLGFGAPLPAGVSPGHPATATVAIIDGGRVVVGLAQVGIGVAAVLRAGHRFSGLDSVNEAWQWQRSATEYGAYSDIPAAEGGTSNPYTPSAGDLGMWLKAKVTYDAGSLTGQTAQATTLQPVLSQAVLSNSGFAYFNEVAYFFRLPVATATTPLYAQGFTTGPDTSGYLLRAVRLSLLVRYGRTVAGTWAVHADDAGKPAAEPLSAARPILDADIPRGHFTFREYTHPDGVRLDPDTRYWVVISQTNPMDGHEIGISTWSEWTGSLEEGLAAPPVDPGSEDGWSVDFEALAHYWDNPDETKDDIVVRPELLPWQTLARAVEIDGRFVLRMALRVAPEVTVQFSQDSYTVAEGGTQSVTVTLSADPERPLVIPITTAGEGGATSTDYSAPTSVTFNAGETSKSFTFAAPQDTLDDDDESVKLGFGTMPDAWVSAGTTDETTVGITDDDDPFVTVEFGASAYTVAESDDTTTPGVTENEVEVTVTLSADPERTLVIPIETAEQDDATSADYSVPASVTFNAGETSKSFTFMAEQDTEDDDGESVRLEFGSLPDHVSAGTTSVTTVNITDDDVPSVTVSFEQGTYTVAEGGTVEVTVTLSADPERSVDIPITTVNQGTASDADYSGVPASVTFQSGETERTITFSATDDALNDDGESIELSFGRLSDRVTLGSVATTSVSIMDDDHPEISVSFQTDNYSVVEGSTTTVGLLLSEAPQRPVNVTIMAIGEEGGATPDDYSVSTTTVTFDSDQTWAGFTFMAEQDGIDDDGEYVRLAIVQSLPQGVSIGDRATTTVNIGDVDDPEVKVSFERGSYTVGEGSTTTVEITLSADPERAVVIDLLGAGQNGATSSDFSLDPARVAFAPGEMSKTVVFSATHDIEDDDGESVELTFGELPRRVLSGTTTTATVNIRDDDHPQVSVNFEQASYTVDEGGTVEVTVTLSGDPERSVDIPITTVNEGTASDADYSGVPSSVVFASGETKKTITFSATQDTEDDDGESVRLAFGALPDLVSAGTPAETTVNITDDDVPSVTVTFGQSSYTVAEGSTVEVSVTLSADPERTVIIPIIRTNQDGASNGDYSGVPESLTFAATETEKSFTFTAVQDAVDDDGESVALAFGTLPDGVTAGTTNTATVSITDDDVPSVTVSFGAAIYSAAEGGTVAITATLSAAPEREVTIPIATTDEGGASADDYSGVPESLTFAATETEKSFTFTAAADEVDDDDESVALAFGTLPDGVTAGTTNTATVSITDDDVPSVTASFEQATYTVAEGGTVEVTVTLSADPEREVTIPITKTDEGGISEDDYSGVPESLTFAATETEQSFTFTAAADEVDDDDESVALAFGTLPDGVTAGTTNTATVSITDDDVPSVTASFEQATYTVAEGGTVEVTVTLSADPEREVTIPITKTDEGGISEDDYSGVPESLTFAATETEQSFTFTAAADEVDDDDESVALAFGTLPDGVTAGTTNTATVSITDDDVPSVTASFEQATYTVAEGGTVEVTVTLSADPEREVTIPITKTDEGGISEDDYSGVPESLTFAATETEQSFTFTAAADEVDDDDESVALAFGTLPDGVTAGTTNTATVSITDDDVPSVTVGFGAATYTVDEGGTVAITATLSAAPEREVTIPITKTDEGGISEDDYSGVPESLTFAATETEKSFTFTAVQDAVDDDGESVQLTFGTLPAQVAEGTTGEAVVSITDDDVPSVTASFEQSSYSVPEGGSASVKVTLSADPERTVTIPITKSGQGGATSADYTVPASVTFNATETEKAIIFSAAQDDDNDDGESVKLGFGTMPGGVSAGTPGTATVSITDDDVPSVTAGFEQSRYTVAEGSTVEVSVTLSADPERTVTIPITKANQDGATSADYSIPASVTFNSGDTEKTIIFSAAQDDDNDDGESVKLTLGNLPDGVSAGSTAEATVSITDDDMPSVTASFGQSSYTAAEGSTVEVSVTLSADPERTVDIPITKANQDGATSADYSIPASVTFNSGDTEKTIIFSAAQDDDNDDGESVKLTLGNLPDGVSAGSTAEATVSITDDDVPSVTVSFGQASYTVAEGATQSVTVTLSGDPERTVVIPITTTEQDGAGSDDYSGVPSSVTFNAGETSKSFTFMAVDDTANDDGERVRLAFGALPDLVSAGTPAETTVSITDDDVPSVTVSFGQASYTVAEGATQSVTVTLSGDPERTVDIPITIDEQDGAGSDDYSGVPSSVTFNAGETSKSFTFMAVDDTANDDGESVRLGFGSMPDARVSAGTPAETTVNITDDDVPSVTVSFGQATYTVAEGATLSVTVTLSGDPERTVVIPITTTEQDGAGSDDYSGVPSSVTFNAGETSKSFTFMAVDDAANDDGEMIVLSFGPLDSDFVTGTPSTATITLVNDDDNGSDECGDAIWCATVKFEGSDSSVRDVDLGDSDFLHKGVLYQGIHLHAKSVIEIGSEPAPPYRIPERAQFYFEFGTCSPHSGSEGSDSRRPKILCVLTDHNHYLDWSLQIKYDDVMVELPLSEGRLVRGDRGVKWYGPEFYELLDHRTLDRDKEFSFFLVETPLADIPTKVPGPPLYPSVMNWNSGELRVNWVRPQTRTDNDYVVLVDNYRVQMKEASGSWDNPDDVTEKIMVPPNPQSFYGQVFGGLNFGVEYQFRVFANDSVGESEPSSVATGSLDAMPDSEQASQDTPDNSPATGGPGITGTVRAGETLTATTDGIADEDGLTNADFAFQWVRHDVATNTDTDIPGARGSTYTVTDEDEAIKVRVSFTDDAGNDESLTSYIKLYVPPLVIPDEEETPESSEAQETADLSLSDFDQEGLETEVLALFVAGDEGDEPALYNAGDRWDASGSLVEGDVDLGPDEVELQRVMYLPDGDVLRLNDAGALVLKDYFGAGGAGHDLTVWVHSGGQGQFCGQRRLFGRKQLRQLQPAAGR